MRKARADRRGGSRRLRRLGWSAAGFGIAVVLMTMGFGATSAAYAQDDDIQVRIPGVTGYATGPLPTLFGGELLAPGDGLSGTIDVRNASQNIGDLRIAMEVLPLEAVCVTNSIGCEALIGALEVTVAVSAAEQAANCRGPQQWTGSMAELSGGVVVAPGMRPGDACRVALALQLPEEAGNDTQGGGFEYILRLGMASDVRDLPNLVFTGGGASGGTADGPDWGKAAGISQLAFTGGVLQGVSGLGAGLLVLGLVLLVVARQRSVMTVESSK